jgi:hypothetical protein
MLRKTLCLSIAYTQEHWKESFLFFPGSWKYGQVVRFPFYSGTLEGEFPVLSRIMEIWTGSEISILLRNIGRRVPVLSRIMELWTGSEISILLRNMGRRRLLERRFQEKVFAGFI